MLVKIRHPEKLIYPETDGKPMGENTIQIKWIIALYNGLEAVFRNRQDVLIAANLFWYPVHGDPTTVLAPDLMVALGPPKGDRPSYKQWEEGGIPPQVVFEILSTSNTTDEMIDKRAFYRRHGAREYYEYDPYHHILRAWVRGRRKFRPVKNAIGFTSPSLGVRFVPSVGEPMRVIGPDGHPFRTYLELLTEAETQQQQVFTEKQRAEEERLRAEKFAAKLRELGVDPHTV